MTTSDLLDEIGKYLKTKGFEIWPHHDHLRLTCDNHRTTITIQDGNIIVKTIKRRIGINITNNQTTNDMLTCIGVTATDIDLNDPQALDTLVKMLDATLDKK